ncbi:hypothetical protein EGW08_000937 [Elysia chlorotica]|uniref:G-protein coupled receptors family 1 profile domain-containing protein n=1 Tax=Elysia chlorotica TaxID=188477 RepID=A0A3S1BTM4_ELYCH|nr:hypothetical protein EGW08_000937 [Elysia chlorotica]
MDCNPRIFNVSTTINNNSNETYQDYQPLPELCDFNANCSQHWGWWILMILLGSTTCSANILSLVVLRRMRVSLTPVLRLALMNLSITDIIGSLSYIYHSIMSRTDVKSVGIECMIRYLFYVGMNTVTLYTLIYMTVERLVAVSMPFIHERVDGKKFTAVALSITWVAALATLASSMHRLRTDLDLCLYHVMVPKSTLILNASLALLTIIFIVVSNFTLFAKARQEIIKIGRTIVGPEANRREQLAQMAEKAASTTLAVVVPFATFNTPLYILMLVFYFNPEFMYSCRSVVLLTWFSTLLVVNSLCNPFIYAWKLRPVQAELRNIILPCLAKNPAPVPQKKSTLSTRVSS